MRSVGVARIKILWFIIEIPIDDTFIIHPKKVKIIKDLTEEEKLVIEHDQEINSVIRQQERESKNIEIALRNAERKERMLKDRYKDNYISKAERLKLAKQERNNDKIKNETVNTDKMNSEFTDVELDEKAVLKMAEETTSTEQNKI
jgi:guanylate kinase